MLPSWRLSVLYNLQPAYNLLITQSTYKLLPYVLYVYVMLHTCTTHTPAGASQRAAATDHAVQHALYFILFSGPQLQTMLYNMLYALYFILYTSQRAAATDHAVQHAL